MADDSLAARLKRGQGLYRQKEYTKALECFDDLVAEYADPPLMLFDCRAATEAKLQKYNAALRDGKRMIHMAKTDATGYLRTGQILAQMEKPEKAWDIYQMGLRKVPGGSNGSKMLHLVANKLAVKLAPRKATDPFTQLPVELVHRIIGYLSFAQMVGLCRVSKGWRDFVTMSPTLWRCMEFKTKKRFISANGMKNYFRYAKGQATQIIVTANLPFRLFAPDLAHHCKQLQHLEINIPENKTDGLERFLLGGLAIKTLILGATVKISATQVWKILRRCRLERAEFWGITGNSGVSDPLTDEAMEEVLVRLCNLRVLCLAVSGEGTWEIPEMNHLSWMPKLHNLEELVLGSCSSYDGAVSLDLTELSKLRYCDIRYTVNISFSVPASLTELRRSTTFTMPENVNFDHGLPHLKTLHLYGMRILTSGNHILRFLEDLAAPLQEIVIDPLFSEYPILRHIVRNGYFDEVRELTLRASIIENEDLTEMASRCLHLHTLRIRESYRVTGIGIRDILQKKGVPLRELDIRGCEEVDRELIAVAVQRGIIVRHGRVITSTNEGRKVRY